MMVVVILFMLMPDCLFQLRSQYNENNHGALTSSFALFSSIPTKFPAFPDGGQSDGGGAWAPTCSRSAIHDRLLHKSKAYIPLPIDHLWTKLRFRDTALRSPEPTSLVWTMRSMGCFLIYPLHLSWKKVEALSNFAVITAWSYISVTLSEHTRVTDDRQQKIVYIQHENSRELCNVRPSM